MAKRFFYVSAGLFLLFAAYSLGADKADAQSGGQFAGIGGFSTDGLAAVTTSGDVYVPYGVSTTWDGRCYTHSWYCPDGTWTYMGNVLGGTVNA